MKGVEFLIDFETFHEGKRVAYHSVNPLPVRAPGRDARRSKLHVTNVRRQQREDKARFAELFREL